MSFYTTSMETESATCPRCGSDRAYPDDKGRGGFYVLGGLFIAAGIATLFSGILIGALIASAIGVGLCALPHIGGTLMECKECGKSFTA